MVSKHPCSLKLWLYPSLQCLPPLMNMAMAYLPSLPFQTFRWRRCPISQQHWRSPLTVLCLLQPEETVTEPLESSQVIVTGEEIWDVGNTSHMQSFLAFAKPPFPKQYFHFRAGGDARATCRAAEGSPASSLLCR